MYTFETHNTDPSINANMTSLVGYLDCPKHVLIGLFGEPIHGSADDKVINSWELEVTDEFGDTGVITIYDWKTYLGSDLPDDFHDWHIGGHEYNATSVIHELIHQLRTER